MSASVEERYLASVCLLARWRGKATITHPNLCSMCHRPIEELEQIASQPVAAFEMTEWRRLDKHARAARLDEARDEAQIPVAAWVADL